MLRRIRKRYLHMSVVSTGQVRGNATTAHLHRDLSTPSTKNKLRKHMPAHTERLSQSGLNAARLYPSRLLPSLQSLLTSLADIDFAHGSDVETVRNSSVDDWLKQTVIRRLEERHRQRRAPYVAQLERLEKRMQPLAA